MAQTVSPAPFTQAQADAGRQEYADNCASCHGDNLEGKGPPPLAGKDFLASSFGKGTTADLYKYIQTSMPFCQGGSLATTAYVNIVAFILQANGAKPGNEPFTPTTSVKVGDIITGETPPGFLNKPK
ncbi:MAG TPA: cytochrome c [Rhizomicrobium sp.]|nr:cytochrome c [Rhizomicrobium sp.]